MGITATRFGVGRAPHTIAYEGPPPLSEPGGATLRARDAAAPDGSGWDSVRRVGVWKKGNAWVRDHSPRFYVNSDLAQVMLDHVEPFAYMDHWSVQPFNGQARRFVSLSAIATSLQPTHVIETGTYLGSSTPYLASFATTAAHTIEIDQHVAERARRRFALNHASLGIDLILGDSATCIARLLASIPSDGTRVLAYLDAHWLDQIPTASEISALDDWGGIWAAVIDDFQVDGDEGYGFDRYADVVIGAGIVPSIPGLQIWVPAEPSQRETGARRGTGYLFSESALPFVAEHALAGLRRVR